MSLSGLAHGRARLLLAIVLVALVSSDRAAEAEGAAAARADAADRWRDNGDGTITDARTGLMWEKKCHACDNLHDASFLAYWSGDGESETVWDWLDAVNSEGDGGFAGHADWRIPNVKELYTLVDLKLPGPTTYEVFLGPACEDRCVALEDPACSCTLEDAYWTSTTFADFPAHAHAVFFEDGLTDDRLKTQQFAVRAVRDGR